MNIPINFDKIDGVKFDLNGRRYRIETDPMEKGDVWVYADNYLNGDIWPLCFDIDWQKQTYALLKCKPGDGRNGNVLVTNAALTKYLMKDADSFVNTFIKDIITILLNSKLI